MLQARPARALVPAILFLPLVAGCREGSEEGFIIGFEPLPVSVEGHHGCDTLAAPVQAPVAELVDAVLIGPESRIAAVRSDPAADRLYMTAADGSIQQIDLGAGPPVLTEYVSAATVDTFLQDLYALVYPGGGVPVPPAVLSGLAVLDEAGSLVVVERGSNVLLLVSGPNAVRLLAGLPGPPGLADGFDAVARFAFTSPTTPVTTGVCPTGSSCAIYVADPGNHALRRIQLDPTNPFFAFVETVAGAGTPGFLESDDVRGDIEQVLFDTPNGLTITCSGRIVVTESRWGRGGRWPPPASRPGRRAELLRRRSLRRDRDAGRGRHAGQRRGRRDDRPSSTRRPPR